MCAPAVRVCVTVCGGDVCGGSGSLGDRGTERASLVAVGMREKPKRCFSSDHLSPRPWSTVTRTLPARACRLILSQP